MTLSKFEKMREQIQKEAEEKLAKLQEEEQKEKERRVGPLVSKYVSLTEDVLDKILKGRVEDLEGIKFKKTDVRKRLEEMLEAEVSTLIALAREEEAATSLEGMAGPDRTDEGQKAQGQQAKKPAANPKDPSTPTVEDASQE